MYRWVTGLLIMLVFTSIIGCKAKVEGFVTTDNASFTVNGKPYYFIGTNYWYGAIIASKGSYGDRPRLIRELDQLKEMGVNNLRIYVGSEGPDKVPFRVTPTLQVAPGVYNEELLDGLDFLLSEIGKRGQYAILFLNNSWDWSGGYSQYLNWNGYGPIPYPSIKPNTWPQFINYAAQFIQCDKCKEQFANHVKFILGRTNRYTGKKYTDDPAIMTWEIGNEPRAFSAENIPVFEEWIKDISELIKSLDENHLVTTGTEGQHGCEESLKVFEQIHSFKSIDYLTMHIWPKNWGWLNIKDIKSTLDSSIINTNIYINDHIAVAKRLNKPIVLEEFGLPRDFHGYSPDESTICRDKYYQNAFEQVIDNAGNKGALGGCNFWTYSGEGRPVKDQLYWKEGDDYLGDPPVEEQGLNSVFDTDKTVSLVSEFNSRLKILLK